MTRKRQFLPKVGASRVHALKLIILSKLNSGEFICMSWCRSSSVFDELRERERLAVQVRAVSLLVFTMHTKIPREESSQALPCRDKSFMNLPK